jgi:4-aminobutyrate aminotransferase-like enzyme
MCVLCREDQYSRGISECVELNEALQGQTHMWKEYIKELDRLEIKVNELIMRIPEEVLLGGMGGDGMVDGFFRDVAVLYEKHTIRMIAPEVQALHAKVCEIRDKLSQVSHK